MFLCNVDNAYQITWYYNTEDHDMNAHCHEDFKFIKYSPDKVVFDAVLK